MKKNLSNIVIGDHTVYMQLRESDDENFLIISAQCGMTQRESSLSLHPLHDRSAESLQADIDARAALTAAEAAGHEQSRVLKVNLFQTEKT